MSRRRHHHRHSQHWQRWQAVRAAVAGAWRRILHAVRTGGGWRAHLLGLAVVLGLSGFTGWQGVRLYQSHTNALLAEMLIDRWSGTDRNWTMHQWFSAHDANVAALSVTPDNPDLHDQLGLLFLMAAREAPAGSTRRTRLFEVAAAHQLASLALRPFHGVGWAALAESLQVVSPASAATWQAWRNARQYAPFEFPVQIALARVGLMAWQQAPADVKAWVRETYLLEADERVTIDLLAEQYGVTSWKLELAEVMDR